MDEFDQKMEISEQPQEEIVEKIPGRDVYETVSSLVSALLVVVLVFTFLVRLMGVSGPSMIPTLQDGDRLLVVNSLLCGDYQVGDIVIARKETFDSPYWNVRRLNGTWQMDGSYELNVLRKPDTYGLAIDLGNTNIEEMTPGGVVIKKDLWLLDGSYQLNGTRILDAIRREEEL